MSNTYYIDGALFADMVKSGAVNLRNNAQTVNELNVFPIPDGDTGETMARTIEGGVSSIAEASDVYSVAEAVARGMLLSARGNSGVILSQFFEGMRKGLKGKTRARVAELKQAFSAGVEQAYSAVVKPTEGTILTVMREATAVAAAVPDDESAEKYFSVFIDEMYASLDRTPELLPVLKESGVIDSGGAGLVYIIEGMNKALLGEAEIAHTAHGEVAAAQADEANDKFTADSEMVFGYCTELIVQLTNKKTDAEGYDVKTLIDYLEGMGGESIVAFKTGTRIKLHVHTFEPDKVIAYCLTVGELVAVKIENMAMQHTEAVVRNRFERKRNKVERKRFAVVAVADGEGLIEQFKSLGADYVVDGKQTMNPSTGDFIAAFDEVNADTVFVLPNNSNVVMAANQAAELYKKANIIVINSTTLAEGYSAMSMYDNSSNDAAEIKRIFEQAVEDVDTGLVTYSVRDCEVGATHLHKGEFMGLCGKDLLANSDDIIKAACKLLDKMDKTDKSVIIAIRGKDYASEEATAKIAEHVNKKYPDLEFYDFYGGQDVYSFVFVVE